MKIATWNIENIYYRHNDLLKKDWTRSLQIWTREFERILSKENKSDKQICRLRELSFLMGINRVTSRPYARMLRCGGQEFIKSFQRKTFSGMDGNFNDQDWTSVQNSALDHTAIVHKVRLIREENPDILILQQVENREHLKDLVDNYLPDHRYSGVYHFNTNTTKDLGFGLILRDHVRLKSFQTYLDQKEGLFNVFENDLQRYELQTSFGPLLIYNTDFTSHFEKKSQIFRARENQTSQIARSLEMENPEIPVMFFGCLQAPRYCDSLKPITQLRGYTSIFKHSGFSSERDSSYQSLGAYTRGVNLQQTMYAIVNSCCFSRIEASGINRKGVYSKENRLFSYETIQEKKNQASSHPLLWLRIS